MQSTVIKDTECLASLLLGPPDMTLMKPENMNNDKTFRHIGFIPDNLYWKSLPSEVEAFLAKSTKPCVYMSMGTVYEVSEDKLGLFIKALSVQRKYSIIWSISLNYESFKEDTENTENGQNLLLVSNIPQLSLLTHKKIDVFITHAGKFLLSITCLHALTSQTSVVVLDVRI